MKTIKLIFMVVVVFVTLGLKGWGQESGAGKNDFGIVIGQIIDPETGKPVKEQFDIRFYNTAYQGEYPSPTIYPLEEVTNTVIYENPVAGYSLRTDKIGYFRRKFFPGKFGIIIAPVDSMASKYCLEFNPSDPKMSDSEKKQLLFVIQVSKGKITRFSKKAIIGGKIKVSIADKNGVIIDQKSVFKPEVVVSVESLRSDLSSSWPDYFVDEGSTKISASLLPGKYTLELLIKWNAYGMIFKKENVQVLSKEINEITFFIDLAEPKLKNVLKNN